ncbi:MAG: hypothetical protein AUK63_882 [bacterium P3]|nr:MAG: hypothetical protein AUK63_882 [bacterium P3]KWW41508.1 MAG: hypothetical protein F083_1070 [bacterium F083]
MNNAARHPCHTLHLWLSVVYLSVLLSLMWLPVGGLGIRMDSFVLGIRVDHLYHAAAYLPAVALLQALFRYRLRRTWLNVMLLSLVTESVQLLLPYRGFDINDLISNLLGVSVGALAVLLFRHLHSTHAACE